MSWQPISGDGANRGHRLDAPAFHRNAGPITEVLRDRLSGQSGHVLEIGSGSGQHAVRFAREIPDFVWWPSDLEEAHLRSIAAWRAHAGTPNLMAPLFMDARTDEWPLGNDGQPPDPVDMILSLNVIHISPWFVAEGILRGAGRHLADDGSLFFYGPFKRDGQHTAESNARFDASLQSQDPRWGVRDIVDLEFCAGLEDLALWEIVQMPANNQVLVFRRQR